MDYIRANTVKEAVQALEDAKGHAKIVAGGTDILLDMDSGKVHADTLVDVMGIPELCTLKQEGKELVIGAGVTLSEISKNDFVRKNLPSLAKGCGSVGSLQIRNVATLSGNVLTAQPAADGAMALAPFMPVFEIQGIDGLRTCGMEEMYAGFGKSTVDSSKELLVRIRVPLLKEGEAASFIRLELRKSLSLPMLNVAARALIQGGVVKDVAITMGPVGVGPKHATVGENWFVGKPFTLENIKEVAKYSLEDAKPRSNPLRGSKEYRIQTLPVLVKRAFLDIAKQLHIEIKE
ncbi:MAG: FAD binding domain-containing protein [Lachnospiraceae bacterium]